MGARDIFVLDSSDLAMPYAKLDQIYPDFMKLTAGEYVTRIGGTNMPWETLNGRELPKKFPDTKTFAEFHSSFADSQKDSPWKIHLSIHPHDLAKAWDIIYPVLVANKLPKFKVARMAVSRMLFDAMKNISDDFLAKRNISQQDKEQALQDFLRVFNGMQVTIYIPEEKEKEYNKLLDVIEPLLYKAGIRPGVIDKSDRAIGLYSSVRHVGKGYVSHDVATGYKAVHEMDKFKAVKLKWDEIQIKWNGLDYANHIFKAKTTLQQVIDAKRMYDKGLSDKRVFVQVYEVALEYFSRWHKLLKNSELAGLSIKDQKAFTELKQWIDDGYKLLPTLREHHAEKTKEDEYRADLPLHIEPLPVVLPPPPLKRTKGRRNLNWQGQTAGSENNHNPTEPEGVDTKEILQKLYEHRRSSFKDLQNRAVKTKSEGFLDMLDKHFGKLCGGLTGASGGALIAGLFLGSWISGGLFLLLLLSAGAATGIAGYFAGDILFDKPALAHEQNESNSLAINETLAVERKSRAISKEQASVPLSWMYGTTSSPMPLEKPTVDEEHTAVPSM
ncbi:hypothetical protein [Legionella cardiaca]|uniref:Dot/Icm T4SS effector n=1 Tax=Legionella cardiaca TaxID=1071983 RepID=A0ABY8APX8_9GAMM|nr:hypothetical protein [Legionella cardiaca]WED42755.1 hypothetical protein PXX05_12750 [Legionella cardiaca]